METNLQFLTRHLQSTIYNSVHCPLMYLSRNFLIVNTDNGLCLSSRADIVDFQNIFPYKKYFLLTQLSGSSGLGRWCGGGGENCSDMRGEVTREGAAAEQKSVVLPGAECGHET